MTTTYEIRELYTRGENKTLVSAKVRCTVTENEQTAFTEDEVCCQPADFSEDHSFVAFENLTKDLVESWILRDEWMVFCGTEMEENALAELVNPTIDTNSLPW
jgi:hypothetical protein